MKPYFALLSLLVAVFSMSTVSATSVRPISLEQLSTRATLIFYGQVISNEVLQDTVSGQIATFTRFEVIDLIKGNTGTSHTIKQIGGYLKSSNTTLRVHGVPRFETGEKYVVFLPTKSVLGFSSPIGLHQGRFSVSTINGNQIVSNGRRLDGPQSNNTAIQSSRTVQIPLAVRSSTPSQSSLNDFINTVRAFNTP